MNMKALGTLWSPKCTTDDPTQYPSFCWALWRIDCILYKKGTKNKKRPVFNCTFEKPWDLIVYDLNLVRYQLIDKNFVWREGLFQQVSKAETFLKKIAQLIFFSCFYHVESPSKASNSESHNYIAFHGHDLALHHLCQIGWPN